ncbi:phosphatidate cytidylyltransferase [Tepidicaulis sp. LMO-SS28]|uniref:phosphatidate cytidylyltransferase n=1 Tax=Tepidicaulis sp. LMO-SS28 TaxID=3447455 RepID=UPI003EDEB1DC
MADGKPEPPGPDMAGPGAGNELVRRIASALALIPAVLALLWLGGWPFAALLAAAGFILAREWAQLVYGTPGRPVAWGTGLAVLLGLFLLEAVSPLAGAAAALTIMAALGVWTALKGDGPGRILGGFAYIVLPILALAWLRQAEEGFLLVLWLVLIVWATDTGAYAAGRLIGGPKLAPRFSPKKTWAGLVGGAVSAALVGALTAGWLLGQGVWQLAALSAVLAVISQAGDIVESVLKRRAGVKDSGTLIPGHGGLLDRVDGLIFACLAASLLALIFQATGLPVSRVLLWP